MSSPNQMPKKNNRMAEQLLEGLITVAPASWERKTLARDEDGKEVVVTNKVVRSVLRNPLAQNVSEETVERIARRFAK